jgi:TRAP-type C4-dicarboxylate transport system permease small subunit
MVAAMTDMTVVTDTPIKNSTASVPRARIVKTSLAVDRVVGLICNAMVLSSTVALLILLGANVAARYAFHEGGIEWISEIPGQLFPWLIAGGIVIAVQRGAHIAVDILYSLLRERAGQCLAAAIYLLVLVSYTALFFVVWQVADIVSVERSPLLGIPNSWGYYALMFGVGGTALCSLTIFVRIAALGKAALPQPNPEESLL